ncbi:hypothetical protein DW074_11530 [Ruminococcus sp. AF46-10NS]|jgi:hypothetical protein|nr:DUF5721 family protein [Ruminococcus sp. AF46-10NS]RHK22966.1 hypothetical protein DW074_11530 [Ruminococcus sp. AF46-10NS]
MLALRITDIRDFTNKLFIGEVFDKFCLTEASITTFNTFTINGRLQKDFFDTDSLNKITEHGRTHSLWKDIRPFCWSVIRGKRTPLSFKIVLHLSRSGVEAAVRNTDLGISSEQIDGLFLNLQFKNSSLLCTTGISLRTFSMDKRPGQLWDDMILHFLAQNQIVFEPL